MGIDYDSKLIYGYEIDYEKLVKYLIENKAGTCDGYYKDEPEAKDAKKEDIIDIDNKKTYRMQCLCGTKHCWKNLKLPEGVYITYSSPYYDCPPEDSNCYIRLNSTDYMTREELLSIKDETIQAAKELAIKLGTTDKEPSIFSAVHIW